MSRALEARRLLLPWLALLPLLPGCQSTPDAKVSVSSESSLLAVDVLFPAPLSRDPSLVQVFLVKGPIHAGLEELPELVPATFVKRSRAYLLDPEPGTYSVVAVTAAFAPPWNEQPIAGVTKTRWSGTSADAMILPSELIHRTRTTVSPGRIAFMGALRVRKGERIDADTVFPEFLQKRLAQHVRPGATSGSGLSGWLNRTWTVDAGETSFSNGPGDRDGFVQAAIDDLGASPWAGVVSRAAPREPRPSTARATPPVPQPIAPIPEAPPPPQRAATVAPRAAMPEREAAMTEPEAAMAEPRAAPAGPQAPRVEPEVPLAESPAASLEPEAAVAEPRAASLEPETTPPEPEAATWQPETAAFEPEPPPPTPKPRRVPGVPPDSPLGAILLGMSHEEVRRILGPPDTRIDRTTSKAWIPFYTGPGAYLREWVYEGQGRVVFSIHRGSLEVLDVIYRPAEKRLP